MNEAGHAELGQLLRGAKAAILADWQARLQALGGNEGRSLTPRQELDTEMSTLLDRLVDALATAGPAFDSDPQHPLAQALRSASELRAARGFSPEETLGFLQAGRQALVAALLPQQASAAGATVDELLDRCVRVLAAGYMAAREEVIKRQGESLREVSTPVISLWDSMLLLPLVGVVDSVRAQQISECLLEAVSLHEAEVTLIDVTGVPVMDTSVARHILKTVAAAEMLGTRVILTGISPTTAQTMVKLGIDLSSVPTRGSLKSGVALAMAMTRRQVVDLPAVTRG